MPFQPTAADLPSKKERHQQGACPERTFSSTNRLCVALIASSLLAGCAVGPDYMGPPHLTLPTQWTNAPPRTKTTGDLGRWWLRLRDSLLTRLIDEAVEANPSVAKAKATVREARATVAQAAAGLFPSVTGSGSMTDNKSSSAGSTGVDIGTSPYTLYQAGFDASWELDLFGGTQRNIEAAIRSEQSAEDELRYSLVTLLGDVAAYYVDARGYQARIALARRTAASQRDTERLTRTKYEAGSATAVDLAKASAQAASTEANIPTYEAALAADTHRLGILLGRAPVQYRASSQNRRRSPRRACRYRREFPLIS
ncbi:NodT family efflux transporter outer membrane factor (OMF) lipoprotein [Bradyrhizobium diazoefficiens]